MNTVQIREERAEDHAAVFDLHLRAFGHHGKVVAPLTEALRRDDPEAFALVAEDADTIVGHVMFSRSLLDAPRRLVQVQVLSPLAVLPEWQRRGIGSALVRRGLEAMDQRGVPLHNEHVTGHNICHCHALQHLSDEIHFIDCVVVHNSCEHLRKWTPG